MHYYFKKGMFTTFFRTAVIPLFCSIQIVTATEQPEPKLHYTSLCKTFPASPLGAGNVELKSVVYFGKDQNYLTGRYGEPFLLNLQRDSLFEPGYAHMYTGDIRFTLGVHRTTNLEIDVPSHADYSSLLGTYRSIGDISVAAQYSFISGRLPKWLALATRFGVITPTGHSRYQLFPRHVYTITTDSLNRDFDGVKLTDGHFYFQPMFLSTIHLHKFLPIPPLTFHFNTSGVISLLKECTSITTAWGLLFRPVSILSLSAEMYTETRAFKPDQRILKTFTTDIITFIPSVRIHLPINLTASLSGNISLSNGAGIYRSNWHRNEWAFGTKALPDFGVSAAITWQGSFSGVFPFAKNTPASAIRGLPGDLDGDSIPDSQDRCKETPEDHDNFEDTDGCPELDNDNDGIIDEIDGCPDNPEDKDEFEDKDGCPDYDNDSDEVPDSTDACPDESGPENSRGCPADGTLLFTRTVLDGIVFDPGTSKITGGHKILYNIVQSMEKLPKATIEIQVHTDNQESFRASAELSQRRADVLKLYLVAKGIRPDRIKAIGLGSEFPIADNTTEEGRAKNRRVELRRID